MFQKAVREDMESQVKQANLAPVANQDLNTLSTKYRITGKKKQTPSDKKTPASTNKDKANAGFGAILSGGFFSSRGNGGKLETLSHPSGTKVRVVVNTRNTQALARST